jgi:HNH endonuclease
MSDVLKALRASADPVDHRAAIALTSLQDSRASRGQKRSLGYDPRDIKKLGTVEVIERRIRKGSNGFDEVMPEDSYEAIVRDFPTRFHPDIVDIAAHRLAAEAAEFPPTSDPEQFDEMVQKLLGRESVPLPKGNTHPKKSMVNSQQFERCQYVAAWVLNNAKQVCESCGSDAPFRNTKGRLHLEVHHVKPLSKGGSDRISNAVAVCPNCHRAFHLADDAERRSSSIYRKIRRLILE